MLGCQLQNKFFHNRSCKLLMTIMEIKKALHDRRPSMVAEKTGLHVNTIIKLRDDKNPNPTLDTLEKLTLYFMGDVANDK